MMITQSLICFMTSIFSLLCTASGANWGRRQKNNNWDFEDPNDNPWVDWIKDYAHYYDEPLPDLQWNNLNIFPSVEDLNKLPICQQQCTGRFAETIQMVLKHGTHYERFQSVCKKYEETVDCMDKIDCNHRELFDVATSGLHYMCIEQRAAFDASIECIDIQAGPITRECDGICHIEEKMTSWAVNSAILDTFREGKMPNLNMDFMQKFIRDGCDLAKCYLTCVKSKFNQRCNGTAGALLAEVFVRPLAESHNLVAFSTMANFMSMFVPKECKFILTNRGLDPYRIDPNLNKELKKMFKVEETTIATEPSTTTRVTVTTTHSSEKPPLGPLNVDISTKKPEVQPQLTQNGPLPPLPEEEPTHLELRPAPGHSGGKEKVENIQEIHVPTESEQRVFPVEVLPEQGASGGNAPVEGSNLPQAQHTQNGPRIPQPKVSQPLQRPPTKVFQPPHIPPPPMNSPAGPPRPNFGQNPHFQVNFQRHHPVIHTPFGAIHPHIPGTPVSSKIFLDKEGEFYHKKLHANKSVLVEIMVYPEFEGQLSCEIRRR